MYPMPHCLCNSLSPFHCAQGVPGIELKCTTSSGDEMTVTFELLDLLKSSNGACSDYRAAKLLGVSQPTMSDYRVGRQSLSAARVVQVCEMLQIDPAPYLVRLQIERAKCDIDRGAWERLLERLAA